MNDVLGFRMSSSCGNIRDLNPKGFSLNVANEMLGHP